MARPSPALAALCAATAAASPAVAQQLRGSQDGALANQLLGQCAASADTDNDGGDYHFQPVASADECCDLCAADPRCQVAVYYSDHCYFKDTVNLAPWSPGRLALTSPNVGPSKTDCSVVPDTDSAGGDYGSVAAGSVDDCCTACVEDARCRVAVLFDGACYLKDMVALTPGAPGRVAVTRNAPTPTPMPTPTPAPSPTPQAKCPITFQLRDFRFERQTGGIRPFITVSCGLVEHVRMDPIVMPDQCNSHMHSVCGSNRFGPTVSVEDMTYTGQELPITTCNVPADGSMYWSPTLYHKRDGKYYATPMYTIAYYFNSGNTHPQHHMPPGLRMLRGNPHRDHPLRNYDEVTSDENNIFWLHSNTGGFPTIDESFWQARIMFPNCWDGKNLQSETPVTNTHVVFKDNATGLCPETHPVRIPQLFQEVTYQIDLVKQAFQGVQRSDFLFATGDSEGWGAHADYIAGWIPEVLDAGTETCFNNDWTNASCAFHQFRGVRRVGPGTSYYKARPVETVDGIEQLLVSGKEMEMSGFPQAPCAWGDAQAKPASIYNGDGAFGTCER